MHIRRCEERDRELYLWLAKGVLSFARSAASRAGQLFRAHL